MISRLTRGYSRFILPLLLLGGSRIMASHIMGADITYRCLGGQYYEFKLVIYRDCGGIPLDSFATLLFSSVSCSQTFSAPLQQQSPALEVSQVCPSHLDSTTCGTGTLPGTEQWIYLDTVLLPAQCADWLISWSSCCRNTAITNLLYPDAQAMCYHVTLNNTGSLCNNSPVYSSLPVPYVCLNEPFCFNHGASEPDGDSLVYSSVAPQGLCGSVLPYENPYSPTNPLATASGFTIDPTTGSMCFTPSAFQQAVIAVLIEEYRNGVKIAEHLREMQVIVLDCNNQPPEDDCNGISNLTGGVKASDYSVDVCPGDTVCWTMCFTDPDGDNVTITSNVGTAIPDATFGVSCSTCTDPEANFCWVPTIQDTGLHVFVVLAEDDGCPISGSHYFAFSIYVADGTRAGNDKTVCSGGVAPTLNASGGSVFTWSVISGDSINVPGNFSCNPCQLPQAYPATTTTYLVTSNLLCNNTDTVTVSVVPSFTLSVTPDSDTICANEAVQLSTSTAPGSSGPFSYQWTPLDDLACNTCPNPVASPVSSTTYVNSVTSAAGCVKQDTVVIIVSGVGPTVIAGPDTSICEGDAVQISTSAFIQPLNCGLNSAGCSGTDITGTMGIGSGSSGPLGPFYGSSSSQYKLRHQYLVRASEMQSAGFVTGGTIEKVALNIALANSLTFQNLSIKMGCTSSNTLGDFAPGLSVVYGPVNYTTPSTTGWNTITLTTPYDWDGTSNLILEFCSDGTPDSNYCTIYTSPTTPDILCVYDYNGNGCSQASGFGTNLRPDIRFTLCQQALVNPSYAWTPGTGLSSTTIPNPVATPSTTTTYQVNVTGNNCIGSDVVTITVGQDFTLTTQADTAICFGAAFPLWTVPSDTGAHSYLWTPPIGLSNPNVSNPYCNPAGSTTYAVEVANSQGCTRHDTVTVDVDGAELYATAVDDSVCTGSTVQLDVSADPVHCGLNPWGCSGSTTTDQVGSDTWSSPTYGPFQGSFQKGRRQYLYSASDLLAAGCTNGTIKQLSWNVTSKASSGPFQGLTIKMMCTGLGDLQPSIWQPVSDVVWGPANYTTAAGWNTITLDVPFDWDGESNVLVEVCYDNPSAIGSDNVEYTNAVGYFATMPQNSATGSGCSLGAGSRYSVYPNIRFGICHQTLPANADFAWSPGADLNDSTIQDPLATFYGTTTYTVTMTDPSNSCPSLSTIVVNIDSINWVDAKPDTLICQGASVQLNADFHGPLAPVTLPCGTNGTTCTETPYQQTVGTGTSSEYYLGPFPGAYADARFQYLIKASELQASGIESGTISHMGFNVAAKNSTGQYKNFTISMGCTNSSSLTIANGWLPVTTVYGPVNYSSTTGWNSFTLSQKFDWDGNSNLVIQVCYNNGNNQDPGGNDFVEYSAGYLYNAAMYDFTNANNSTGCTMAPVSVSSLHPKIQFTVCPGTPVPITYSWTPSTGLSCTTCPNPVATPSSTITYAATVQGGVCTVLDSVTVTVKPLLNPITWTGAINNDWFRAGNWNSCILPACGIGVIIPGGLTNYPIINTSGFVCQNVTIDPGASVTLNTGITWQVCGNFANNGTLTAQANSTVEFIGNAAQQISGNVSGTSAFANLRINKTGGSVTVNSTTIEVKRNFTTSTATSVFNSNGKHLKLGGDFLNSSGGTTFTNAGTTGVLEFNGSVPQLYSPGGSLTVNDVTMNHTSTGVTINADLLMGTSGDLILNQGVIITNTKRVIVNKTALAAVTTGNTGSYVQGNLRRYLSSLGTFEFPVGHAAKGYQRATINFVLSTSIGYLDARFDPWPVLPPPLMLGECNVTYAEYSLDNGYWTINANANANTGMYTGTLWNANYTNASGNSWTVMRDPTNTGTTWGLVNGDCEICLPQQTIRTDMVGFSLFATTQAMGFLPLELLSFTGHNAGAYNLLEWITATEFHSDYFTVEHSTDQLSFQPVAEVDAAGFSASPLLYKAYHYDPQEGSNYYRLKQTDQGGRHSYSSVIEVGVDLAQGVEVATIFPNPTSNEAYVHMRSPMSAHIRIVVEDGLGRIVLSEERDIERGTSILVFGMGEFAAGMYSIKILSNEELISTTKLVKSGS